MKEFLAIIVLGLFWCSVGSADTRGIKKLILIVEDVTKKSEKVCLVARKDIETRIKYILTNSKLELVAEYQLPRLWAQPLILGDSYQCSGVLNFRVHASTSYNEKHSLGSPVYGDFIFYQQSAMVTNSPSKFRNSFLTLVEDMTREFVVVWHDDNK